MKVFCNPLNLPYQYQFCKNRDGHLSVNREADKLYHSRMCFEPKAPIGALIKGQNLFIRVDSFNENGITEGEIIKVKEQTP